MTRTIEPSGYPDVITFLGDCHGVRLVQRDPSGHLLLEWLTEDDTHWKVTRVRSSSGWLPDLTRVLDAARSWMDANATPDPDGAHLGFTYAGPVQGEVVVVSGLSAAAQDLDVLGALGWYAEPRHWDRGVNRDGDFQDSPAMNDEGQRARNTLARRGPPNDLRALLTLLDEIDAEAGEDAPATGSAEWAFAQGMREAVTRVRDLYRLGRA